MEDTRDRLLAAAAYMFRAQGVHGSGTLAILERARAPRGSLYHHFPGGKAELVLAALDYEARRISDGLTALSDSGIEPAAAVIVFADELAGALEASDYRLGCPIATAALELASDDPQVRDLCARTYRTWQDVIAARLTAFGIADAQERAEMALCAVEGALVLARVHRDANIIRRTAARVAESLMN
ncbi:TetR/AcrR family transcriptional regulator [Dactylosporangium sp. CA-092794]|uniref:TetR/AcrR family transcriptional regulator n=1 Tax=Dactylosporangium sp. CA-092794 TaxID=3239929 RepID=UPI003D8BB90D